IPTSTSEFPVRLSPRNLTASTGAALLCAALSGQALAQRATRDTASAKRDSTAKRATVLDPVHVIDRSARAKSYAATMTASATKTATPLIDVPQSVTVINRNLMADLSVQGLADVVRYVPGIVMAQGEGNRDQPTIRGNNTSSDLYVDGMRD